MPLGCLMSPARREQRHGLGHRGAFESLRCSRVEARKREGPMSVTRRRSAATDDGDSARSRASRRVELWRRLGRGALIVAAGTAALALAGPLALRPFVDGAGIAGAAGEVSVAFVLDFGPGTTPVSGCVNVPASDNDYDALAAFVHQEGMAPPTFASSGLLCSINVVPSSGCGQSVAGGYVYWSYFTGRTGSWTYASSGAFGTVSPGDVEGWRFQNPGSGRPNDPAPRTPPQYASICSSGPGTPSTTMPAATTTTTGGGDPHTPTHTYQAGAAAAPRTPAPAGTSTTGTSSSTTTSCPSTTTTSTAPSGTSTSVPDFTVPSDPVVNLANGRPTPTNPGTGSDSLIVGGLLIAALGIAAFARWRKRPRTP